jgi:hypothetical protein
MNKDLLIEGKEYISASRAANKLGYSQDYVGELARTGKVPGRMIGRTWYVDATAITEHKTTRGASTRVSLGSELSKDLPIAQIVGDQVEATSPKSTLLPELKKPEVRKPDTVFSGDLNKFVIATVSLFIIICSGFNTVANISPKTALNLDSKLRSLNQASALGTFFDGLLGITNTTNPIDTYPFFTFSSPVGSGPANATTTSALLNGLSANIPKTLNLDKFKLDLEGELQAYVRSQVALNASTNISTTIVREGPTQIIYRDSSFDQTAFRSSILSDVYAHSSSQSSSNADSFSVALSRLQNNGSFTSPSIAGGSISGSTITNSSLTGTFDTKNGTSTSLYAGLFTAGSATSTNLFANNAHFDSLSAGTLSVNNGNFTVGSQFSLTQAVNGTTQFYAKRATDVAPSGDFIAYYDAAGVTPLFRVDNSGNIYAGGITNSGALTVTSLSGPQFRVQYDSTNENTNTVTGAGITTFGFNGITPKALFTPQMNGSNTFQFTDASSSPVLSLDTILKRVNYTNLAGVNSTTTSATTTNFFATNGAFGNLTATSFSTGNSSVAGLNFTNATGTNATTTAHFSSILTATSAILTNATTTSFFTTTGSTTNLFYTNGSGGALTLSGTLTGAGALITGSSSLQAFTFTSATGTSATSTNLFATNAVATNLAYTSGNGTTLNITGLLTAGNILTTGSSTLQNFTGVNGTTTNATSTSLFATTLTGTNATLTNISGSALAVGLVTPASSAIVDITSTTKGFLAPRMTDTQRDAIVSPAAGLMIYNTVSNAYNVYNGSTWASIGAGGGSSQWTTTGSNIYYTTGNIGVGTNQPFSAKIESFSSTATALPVALGATQSSSTARFGNGTVALDFGAYNTSPSAWIQASNPGALGTSYPILLNPNSGSTGFVGIGNTNPTEKLDIQGTIATNVKVKSTGAFSAGLTLIPNNNAAGFSISSNAAASPDLAFKNPAGTDVFHITNAGNVGIGITAPHGPLEIAAGPFSSLGVPSNQAITISGGGGVGQYNQIGFGYSAGDVSPGVIGYITTSGAGSTKGALIFATRDVTTPTAPTERVRIDSAGNVGIGTTNPTALLTVGASQVSPVATADLTLGLNRFILWGTSGSGASTVRSWGIANNENLAGDFVIKSSSTNNNTLDTTRLAILSSGNVGIGTTNPLQRLHVVGNTTSQALILTATSDGSKSINMGIASDIGYIRTETATDLTLGTGGNERLRIVNSTGGVNVLALAGTGNRCLKADSAGNIVAGSTDCSTGGSGADNLGNHIATQNIQLNGFWLSNAGASEGIRVATGGNVGIGVASPADKLTVLGTSSVGLGIDSPLLSNNSYLNFRQGGVIKNQIISSATSGDLNFWTGNGSINAMTIQQSSGNVGIGTTTPTAQLSVECSASSSFCGSYIQNTAATAAITRLGIGQTLGAATALIIQFDPSAGNALILNRKTSTGTLDLQTTGGGIRIDNAGNVGIGLTNQTLPLQIAKDGATLVGNFVSAFAAQNTARTAGIILGYDATNILGMIASTNTTSGLAFVTNSGGSNLERLRITSAGNVGIGTTSPQYQLHVQNDQNSNTFINAANATNGTSARSGFYATNSSNTGISLTTTSSNYTGVPSWANRGLLVSDSGLGGITLGASGASSDIRFETGGTGSAQERVRITSTGNVGIGTTTPLRKLHVSGDFILTDNTKGLLGLDTSFNQKVLAQIDSSNAYQYANGLVSVLSNGNVGIGTTTPNQLLGVAGKIDIGLANPDVNGITMTAYTATNANAMKFTNGGGNYFLGVANSAGTRLGSGGLPYSFQMLTESAQPLQFGTNNAVAMTILSGGNVGIGTTNPQSKLDVGTSATIGGYGVPAASYFGSYTPYDASGYSTFNQNGTVGYRFQQNGGTNVTILNNGNVGIGTTNPLAKLHVNVGTDQNLVIRSSSSNVSLETQNDAQSANTTMRFQASQYAFITGNMSVSALSGTGNRCLKADSAGNIVAGTTDCSTGGSGADNLGNHIATQNVQLNGFWLSNNGSSNGIRVDNSGNVGIGAVSTGPILYVKSSNPVFRVQDSGANGSALDILADNTSVTLHANYASSPIPIKFMTSSLERMRIDTAGNLGIGVTNPSNKLQVAGGITSTGALAADVPNALSIDYVGTSYGRVYVNGPDTSTNGTLRFVTARSNGSNLLTAMVIDNAGNVGIGTTTPSNILTAYKSQTAPTFIEVRNPSVGASAQAGVDLYSDTTRVYLSARGSGNAALPSMGIVGTQTNQNFSILTNDTQRMTFDTAGNVGIGTTTPAKILHVFNGTGGETVRIDGAGNGATLGFDKNNIRSGLVGVSGAIKSNSSMDLALFAETGNGISFMTNGSATDSMTITSTGLVGIGTTAPGALLDVQATNATALDASDTQGQRTLGATMRVYNLSNTDNSFSQLLFGNRSSGFGVARIVAETINGGDNVNLHFITEGSGVPADRMTIKNDGNIGINTVSPNRAGLNATDATVLSLEAKTASGGSVLELLAPSTAAGNELGRVYFARVNGAGGAKTGAGAIIATSDNGNDATNLSFFTQAAGGSLSSRMKIDSAGNVGIGTTAPNYKLEVKDSIGISATATNGSAGITFCHYSLICGAGTGSGVFAFQDNGDSDFHGLNFKIHNSATFSDPAVSAMVIKSNGNIGIGTTNPTDTASFGRIIDLQGPGSSGMYFRASNTSPATQYFTVGYSPTAAYLFQSNNAPMYFYTNSLLRMTLDASGILNVAGLAGTGNRCLKADSAGNIVAGTTDCSTGGSGADNLGNHIATQNIQLNGFWLSNNGSSNGIRVSNAGEVGIGAAPLASIALNIVSAGDAIAKISTTGGAYSYLQLNTPSSGDGYILKNVATGNSVLDKSLYLYNSNGPIQFVPNATNASTVTINNAGFLGIGTMVPGYPLVVKGSGSGSLTAAAAFRDNSTNGNELMVRTATGRADLLATWEGTAIDTALTFTPTTSAGVQNEAMRITAAGNVGIGTTNPLQALHISGSGVGGNSPAIRIDGTNAAVAPYVEFDQNGTQRFYLQWAGYASQPYFDLGGAVAIKSGNVGIGTTTPASKLDVNGALTIETGCHPNFQENSLNIDVCAGVARFAAGNNSHLPMALNPFGGNVGIGTTNPNSVFKLDVVNAGNSSASYIRVATTTNDFNDLLIGVNSDMSASISNQMNAPLIFGTNNTEQMRITPAGNIGIGTTNPLAKLDLGVQAPGTNTALTYVLSAAGNSNWVQSRGAIYDATSVDQYQIFNGQITGGTKAAPTFTGSPSGGYFIRNFTGAAFANSRLDLGYFSGTGAGTTGTSTLSIVGNNVGIGTTNPARGKFTVLSTAGTGYVTLDNFQTVPVEPTLSLRADATGGIIETYGSGYKNLNINPNGGNVSIGTTTALAKLSVQDTSNPYAIFAQGTGGTNLVAIGTRAGNVPAVQAYTSAFATASLALQPEGGNVGIGRTDPTNAILSVAVPNAKTTVASANAAMFGTNEAFAGAPFGVTIGVTGAAALANRYVSLATGDFYSAAGGNLVFQPSGGNVGIGTTNPSGALEVVQSTAGNGIVSRKDSATLIGTDQGAWLQLRNFDTTNNDYAHIAFTSNDSNAAAKNMAEIAGVFTNHSAAGYSADLVFLTSSAANPPSEKMRVTSGGNVGIGITNPGAKLQVYDATSAGGVNFNVQDALGYGVYVSANNTLNFNNGYNGYTAGWINYAGYNNAYTQFRDLNIANGKSGAIASFIGSTNNVGIGTGSPNAFAQLHIKASAAAATADLRLEGTGTGAGSFDIFSSFSGGSKYFAIADADNSNATRFSILNNGHVFVNGGVDSGHFFKVFAQNGGTYASEVGNNGSVSHFSFQNLNGSVGSITTSGSATAYNTASDKRLKNDLGTASNVDVLKNIVIHNFTWKADGSTDEGVFAQDAYLVKPNAVHAGDDAVDANGHFTNPWAVDYSKFVPDLIVGWQMHEKVINGLALDLASATSSIAYLENFASSTSARIDALDMKVSGLAADFANATSSQAGLMMDATSTEVLAASAFANASDALKQGILALGTSSMGVVHGAFYSVAGVFDKVFARSVHTDLICVTDASGETCVTRAQLNQVLAGSSASASGSASGTSSGSGSAQPAPAPSSGSSASSTPDTTASSTPSTTPDASASSTPSSSAPVASNAGTPAPTQ